MSKNLPARLPDDSGEFLLYQTEDGRTRIDVRMAHETLWRSRRQHVVEELNAIARSSSSVVLERGRDFLIVATRSKSGVSLASFAPYTPRFHDQGRKGNDHPMQYMSLLGLCILLFLCYCMSTARSRIRLRTIVWGLTLQLLFALIILNRNPLSLVGVGILALLLLVYTWSEIASLPKGLLARGLIVAAASIASFAALAFVVPSPIRHGILVLAIVALAVNGFYPRNASLGRWTASALIVTGPAIMFAEGIFGRDLFQRFSDGVTAFLQLSDFGARFLFGNLARAEYYFPQEAAWPGFGFLFAFKVLPTIIFFGAVMSVLYHLGIMQRMISAMARFMQWTMGTGGAETLSCTANIFVGQTEAPLLIKPFLSNMTNSELSTVMVGGFATIAGGVLAGYIAMGIDAGYLIAASVMAAPAALLVGKIIHPESEDRDGDNRVELPNIQQTENVLDAASVGISDGLKLAVNVGAMLLGFIALIAVLDLILNQIDYWIDGRLLEGELVHYTGTGEYSPAKQEYSGIFPGSLMTIFSTLLRPLAWLMGVPWQDAGPVANLIGIKLTLNEFVAYGRMAEYLKEGALSPRAELVATYALCGFANFSSIGIQIGGIGAMAPERRKDLSRIALRAMFGGAIASFLTACVAGLFFVDSQPAATKPAESGTPADSKKVSSAPLVPGAETAATASQAVMPSLRDGRWEAVSDPIGYSPRPLPPHDHWASSASQSSFDDSAKALSRKERRPSSPLSATLDCDRTQRGDPSTTRSLAVASATTM